MGGLLKKFFVSHGSVLGRKIPTAVFSEIDGCNGWNLYPVCKHANVTLMQSVKQELIDIKAPIRITVSSREFHPVVKTLVNFSKRCVITDFNNIKIH